MKEVIDHLRPKYIKREREAKTNKILETETEIYHLVGIGKTIDKTLDLTIGENHSIDETTGRNYRCQNY